MCICNISQDAINFSLLTMLLLLTGWPITCISSTLPDSGICLQAEQRSRDAEAAAPLPLPARTAQRGTPNLGVAAATSTPQDANDCLVHPTAEGRFWLCGLEKEGLVQNCKGLQEEALKGLCPAPAALPGFGCSRLLQLLLQKEHGPRAPPCHRDRHSNPNQTEHKDRH